jgi:predicted nucleic acid-binding protein
MNRLLTDSSFLFALFSVDDAAHRQASHFIAEDRGVRLMPDVILPEVTFLMNRAGGTLATLPFCGRLPPHSLLWNP